MMEVADTCYENQQNAALAFSKQAVVFDRMFSENGIVQYKRDRVRAVLKKLLTPGLKILELNSGTGEDAVWFAQQGHDVHATDISAGMQETLSTKVSEAGLQNQISSELCSFTNLGELRNKGPYDLIFSNFGGLNCTGNLDGVLDKFGSLLRPGGTVVLVVISPICLWELLLVFKGKFRTATRRLGAGNGVQCNVEGINFKCWYHSSQMITRELESDFSVIGVEGLCAVVPPSYIDQFPQRYPRLFKLLARAEQLLKNSWPLKYLGDYYIISFRRKDK